MSHICVVTFCSSKRGRNDLMDRFLFFTPTVPPIDKYWFDRMATVFGINPTVNEKKSVHLFVFVLF